MCRFVQCSVALGRGCISMVQCMLSGIIVQYCYTVYNYLIELFGLYHLKALSIFVIKAFKIFSISYYEAFDSLLSVRVIPLCCGRLGIIFPSNHILDCLPLTLPFLSFPSHSSQAPVITLFTTYPHAHYYCTISTNVYELSSLYYVVIH